MPWQILHCELSHVKIFPVRAIWVIIIQDTGWKFMNWFANQCSVCSYGLSVIEAVVLAVVAAVLRKQDTFRVDEI